MTPETKLVNLATTESAMPSYTYKIDFEKGRVISMVDNEDALYQACLLRLLTERYAFPIYPGSYGVELDGLVGKDYDYILNEARRRISEALMVDLRIKSISDFIFEKTSSTVLTISFKVNTAENAFIMRTEVPIL